MKKVLGTKMKMSQLFEDTIVIPVTPIAVSKDDVGHFEKGAHVKVRAVSKGKGFQGVVKRWNFGGGPKTHGQKHSHRAPGSIGATGPQRVIKGLKMAGRMGGVNVTVRNLKLVDINSEKNTVFVRGAVPGNVGGRVEVYVEEKAKADKKASE